MLNLFRKGGKPGAEFSTGRVGAGLLAASMIPGMFQDEEEEEYIDTRYSDKTLKLVDRVYAWGNFDYINLINRYRQFKSKV